MVNSEVPPDKIGFGLKALPTVGGCTAAVTVSVALAGAVLEPPLVVETLPAASVSVPVAVAVTWTVTVQKLLAAIVPVARLTVLAAATAVTVPPAHVVAPAGAALLSMLA